MTDLAEKIARVIEPTGWAFENAKDARGEMAWSAGVLRRNTAIDKARAILALLEPEGWQLVPKKATREQLAAATGWREQDSVEGLNQFDAFERIYRVMVSASPLPSPNIGGKE